VKNRTILFALLLSTLVIARLAVADESKTYRIPFHTVGGMILLDAVVDGKPASLPLDIGANNAVVTAQAAEIRQLIAVPTRIRLALRTFGRAYPEEAHFFDRALMFRQAVVALEFDRLVSEGGMGTAAPESQENSTGEFACV
jgi:hypothetical protein